MFRRCVFYSLSLACIWAGTATLVAASSPLLEMISTFPLHRGDYAGAEPFVQSRAALSRLGVWIGVPGQKPRLADALGDLGEIQMWRGDLDQAQASYLESIRLFESEQGTESAEARHARWRYADFRRQRAQRSIRP